MNPEGILKPMNIEGILDPMHPQPSALAPDCPPARPIWCQQAERSNPSGDGYPPMHPIHPAGDSPTPYESYESLLPPPLQPMDPMNPSCDSGSTTV